jgi:hypothetical protein
MRHCFLVMVLTLCCSSFAFALEWDVTVPGAKARLGFGGGFFNGAWSQLRLEASGAGAYRLKLATLSGRFRDGLLPLTAKLEVPEGSGVRVQTLILPLSNHVVRLTLEGETGAKTVTLEPLNTATSINLTSGVTGARGNSFELSPEDLPVNPALMLGVPEVIVSENGVHSGALLAALAAGSRVFLKSDMKLLEHLSGTVGLGRLERNLDSKILPASLSLDSLAKMLAPQVHIPAQRHQVLGWWAVVGFIVALWVYSARRFEVRFVWGSGTAMFVFGLVGFWAFTPQASSAENTAQVLIGSRGWGLKLLVTSRLDLRATKIHLPSGAKILSGELLEYHPDGVDLQTKAWRNHSFVLPPVASMVPLRVSKGYIENTGSMRFSEVQVVGYGAQEPLAPGSRLKYQETGISGSNNFETLPKGSVVARVNGSQPLFVIALPEVNQ